MNDNGYCKAFLDMKQTKWSLIDLKTNGFNAMQDSIIDIAIVTLEDWSVIERWQSLVKPKNPIPYQIEQLTGISNTMISEAKTFKELAFELYSRLSGTLLISHNARFNYAHLKNAFSRQAINFREKVACRIKLSRSLYPQFKSDTIDSLTKRLEFEDNQDNRAMVDVDLTQHFLLKCRNDFGCDTVVKELLTLSKSSSRPSNLSTHLDTIPDTSGVYLFYSQNNQLPIYIGKSINLRKRILSHFSADYTSAKELKISQHVNHIEWQETAGELSALLLESKLIKEIKPLYNRRLRQAKKIAGFKTEVQKGYKQIKIVYIDNKLSHAPDDIFGSFRNKCAAEIKLWDLIKTHNLCPKLCGLDKSTKQCFDHQLKRCEGACIKLEWISSRYEISMIFMALKVPVATLIKY